MRYYVIINGVNSLTIEGLAIRTLPPISKPAMRNIREEIDGRDGDITTELGYGAYDRPLEIGLFGDYDINKIISFFNSKGTIIFSDEPDKYYNFEIVDKIDYTKLVKFRTATINIHCQPFKYPVSEEPQVEEYEYVEATGTNVTLDNTSEAIFNKIDLLGNTSQEGTPTPSSPIPINVVSGDNEINVVGKNLLVPDTTTTRTSNGITSVINEDGSLTLTGTATANAYLKFTSDMTLESNTTYTTLNQNSILPNNVTMYYNSVGNIGSTYADTVISPGGRLKTYTTGEVNGTISIAILVQTGVTINTTLYPMLLKGTYTTSSIPTYEPYIGNSYPIYLGMKNLWNRTDVKDGFLPQSGSYPVTNSSYPNSKYIIVPLLTGQKLTLSGSTSSTGRVRCIDKDTNQVVNAFTATETEYYTTTHSFGDAFYNATITAKKDFLVGIMDYVGFNQYLIVNYGATPQTISETPIELCKIGDYQDYIYKDNGVWYLHKEIGKVIFTNTTNWYYDSGGSRFTTIVSGSRTESSRFPIVSNYFKYISSGGENGVAFNYSTSIYLYNYDYTNVDDFKTWLGTHNTTVYYILAKPTNTLIEDTTLIEQLEALRNAASYSGQTNVSQTNNDMPFILDISALKEDSDHLVINNAGNIYAKPTMDLEGTGVVDIYLNDVQILEADLTETNNIVIDTESMEAYNPDTNALANRKVTGDYSKIKLEPGDNDLRFSGDLSKATITDYTRWL